MAKNSYLKSIKRIAFGIATPIVIVLVLQFGLGSAIRSTTEALAPAIIGAKVKVKGAKVKLLQGECRFEKIIVGSPEGFKENVFEFTDTVMKVSLKSFFSKTVLVNEIYIRRPKIVYEVDGYHSNVNEIIDRLQKSSRSYRTFTASDEQKVMLETIIISGADVKLSSRTDDDGMRIPMADIVLRDIGYRSGGLTTLELMAQTLSLICGRVIDAGNTALGLDAVIAEETDAMETVGGAIAGAVSGGAIPASGGSAATSARPNQLSSSAITAAGSVTGAPANAIAPNAVQ